MIQIVFHVALVVHPKSIASPVYRHWSVADPQPLRNGLWSHVALVAHAVKHEYKQTQWSSFQVRELKYFKGPFEILSDLFTALAMDPYCPPPPNWKLPKQPPLYDVRTLVGNWFERQVLAEDVAKYEAGLRNKISLDVDHRIWIYEESKKTYAETGPYEDGSLYFGDTIQLGCVGMVPPTGRSHEIETPVLSIDLHMASVEDSGTARAYGSITDTAPKGRSIFTIKSENRIEYPNRTRKVCFGDAIYLVSAIDWQGMEWRLTSALEHLYDINLDHRKQTVWLYPLLTKKSLWSFQYVDRHLRPIMEGQPVDARQPVILRHVLTGRNLTVNFQKRFRTTYGVEYLMTCDLDRDIDKVEKPNSLFQIRQISFPPWKLDREQEKHFRADLEEQIDNCNQIDLNKYAHLEAADAVADNAMANFERRNPADARTRLLR